MSVGGSSVVAKGMQCVLMLGLELSGRGLCQRKLFHNNLALAEGGANLPRGVRQKLNFAFAR
eukprot:677244-Rhodomonas_salina.1